ncbi:MAG: 5-formyltetrahydrofolate cyclo-ligase [unclassified Hahellaceae]|nr:5-formyltetrahydrofolate cyclo-ligase [Hahellaceae bacterium]
MTSQRNERSSLRQQMRRRRRSLTATQRRHAARGLASTISRQLLFRRNLRWGLYLANDGEIDPGVLAKRLLRCKRQLFLPILHPVHHGRLCFARFYPGMPMVRNRFGISEPRPPLLTVPLWTLSTICVPLVAFDDEGNRLGMGGGYYDRSFGRFSRPAGSAGTGLVSRPLKLGVAYDFQGVERLPSEPWDIPLDAIASDRRYQSVR